MINLALCVFYDFNFFCNLLIFRYFKSLTIKQSVKGLRWSNDDDYDDDDRGDDD